MSGEPIVILLVEDNHDHAELIRRNLEDAAVANRLVHVDDGESALRYLLVDRPADRANRPLPHLILLDLRLPRVDGLEVLRQVKDSPELKVIPVVVLTSSDGERDVAMAYRHHANSYLTKPVDFDQFASLLKDLGFYWLAWNRHPWPSGSCC